MYSKAILNFPVCFGGLWGYTTFSGSFIPPQGFWVSLSFFWLQTPGSWFLSSYLACSSAGNHGGHAGSYSSFIYFWGPFTNNHHRKSLLTLLLNLEVLHVASCSAIFTWFFAFSLWLQAPWFAYCFDSPLLFILILVQRHQTLPAFLNICISSSLALCSLKAA